MQNNDIEINSTHNEGSPAIAETFLRTLKNKIYMYITSVSKDMYIGNLADIVNKYSNTYNSAIKMKPAILKSNRYWIQ